MSAPAPVARATHLVVALPALTKDEASLLAWLLSMAVRDLRGDNYRPIVDFRDNDDPDDRIVNVLLMDYLFESEALNRGGPAR